MRRCSRGEEGWQVAQTVSGIRIHTSSAGGKRSGKGAQGVDRLRDSRVPGTAQTWRVVRRRRGKGDEEAVHSRIEAGVHQSMSERGPAPAPPRGGPRGRLRSLPRSPSTHSARWCILNPSVRMHTFCICRAAEPCRRRPAGDAAQNARRVSSVKYALQVDGDLPPTPYHPFARSPEDIFSHYTEPPIQNHLLSMSRRSRAGEPAARKPIARPRCCTLVAT